MSKQNPNIIKKTKAKELVLTEAEDHVELVERRLGKDGAAYGITLRGRVLEIWKEEGGVRRVALSEELPEDEAERVKGDMLRVGDFTSFATLAFFLLYVRKKLAKGARVDPRI
jgi:hypothetical protein